MIKMCNVANMRLFLVFAAACLGLAAPQVQARPWQSNWSISPGYFLEVDTSGYTLPVAIAFVPNPGTAPEAPLYYVAELGGRILAVRNDRQIEVFAENFYELTMTAQMPELAGVLGLTGLCVDADTGYLFAAYVHDTNEGRYNGITRFSTTPGTFSLRPNDQLDIHKPFLLGDSDFTRFPFGHQIGQCQIINNNLYVGIGDGELTYRSRSDKSSFGKILRMQFDGSPVDSATPGQAAPDANSLDSYIFASGLRNPFGQTLVGDNIVVADNGPGVDRVLMVREGKDYLYDGSDASIATNAMVVLAPAKGTANIAFYPSDGTAGAQAMEELKDNVIVVLSGVPEIYIKDERAELAIFPVEPDTGLVLGRPQSLVKYTGNTLQVLSSVAIAQDSIYFAPVYGEESVPGISNVYRLSWAPDKSYPNVIKKFRNPKATIRDNGCKGCHSIFGEGGNIGPALTPAEIKNRNLARLESPEFEALLADLNAQNTVTDGNAGRYRVLQKKGQERLAAWVEEKILDPTFDNSHSIMPLLSITRDEAKVLTGYLLNQKKKPAPKPPPQKLPVSP